MWIETPIDNIRVHYANQNNIIDSGIKDLNIIVEKVLNQEKRNFIKITNDIINRYSPT